MQRLIAVFALAGCHPTVEYFYGHRIEGRVIDEYGPVAGAVVERVDAAGVAVDATSDVAPLYRRTSGPDGRFVFEFDGLGGADRPPTDTWHIAARDRGVVVRGDVVARWTCDATGCPGYRGDIVLRIVR